MITYYQYKHEKIHADKRAGRCFLKPFLSHSRKLFFRVSPKTLSFFRMISLAYKIANYLSANHNPELRCVIYTGVTLFAPVLHLNFTVLSQSESSIFS